MVQLIPRQFKVMQSCVRQLFLGEHFRTRFPTVFLAAAKEHKVCLGFLVLRPSIGREQAAVLEVGELQGSFLYKLKILRIIIHIWNRIITFSLLLSYNYSESNSFCQDFTIGFRSSNKNKKPC